MMGTFLNMASLIQLMCLEFLAYELDQSSDFKSCSLGSILDMFHKECTSTVFFSNIYLDIKWKSYSIKYLENIFFF